MKLITVVGCQRSGTTLVGQILGAQKQCFLIDEPDGIYEWFDLCVLPGTSFRTTDDAIVGKAAKKYIDSRKRYSVLDDLGGYYFILKSPNLTHRIEDLLTLSPRPRIIFPVRDVRSVVASMRKLSTIPMVDNQVRLLSSNLVLKNMCSDDLRLAADTDVPMHIRCAAVWKMKTGLYKRYVESSLSTLVFRYEELVTEPSRVIKRIMNHCELGAAGDYIEYPTVLSGFGPGNTSRERRVDESSLEKWRTDLSIDEIHDIAHIANDLMIELGYPSLG